MIDFYCGMPPTAHFSYYYCVEVTFKLISSIWYVFIDNSIIAFRPRVFDREISNPERNFLELERNFLELEANFLRNLLTFINHYGLLRLI